MSTPEPDKKAKPLSWSSFGISDVGKVRKHNEDSMLEAAMSKLEARHQIANGVSLNGGYYRRAFGNDTFTDDLRYDQSSYDSFCITVPSDPDLPNGGNYQVCGVQDLKPAVFAQNLPANSLIRYTEDFGGTTNLYQGYDLNLEGRFKEIGRAHV